MARVVMAYRLPKTRPLSTCITSKRTWPLTQMLPGLRKMEILQGPGAIENEDFHLLAFHFDDANSAEWALASPQGLAAEADRKTMAPDDDVVMFLTDGYEM